MATLFIRADVFSLLDILHCVRIIVGGYNNVTDSFCWTFQYLSSWDKKSQVMVSRRVRFMLTSHFGSFSIYIILTHKKKALKHIFTKFWTAEIEIYVICPLGTLWLSKPFLVSYSPTNGLEQI